MTSTLSREHIALRKLWWVGLLAIVSAILANLIVRAIAVASFSISGTVEVFAYPPETVYSLRGDMQKPPASTGRVKCDTLFTGSILKEFLEP